MSKCNVQQLVDNAGCFFCLSPGEIQAAKLSLLCKIAQKLNSSISCSPNSLLANATEFVTLDNGMRDVVKAQLLCEIWKGGGSGIILTLPTDPDAAAFVCGWLNICAAQTGECTSTNNCAPGTPVPISALCASFCGITQTEVNAVETLVTQLKAAGLWDLMDVIYPFVGGNAGACSLNMKDTTKFAITWHGGVTFSAVGVTGDGSTGYGDTGYNPAVSGVNYTLNSAAMGFYRATAVSSAAFAGAINILGAGTVLHYSLVTGWSGEVNNGSGFGVAADPPSTGNYSISRTASNLTTIRIPSGSNATDANVAAAIKSLPLWVLADNFESVAIDFSADTLAFMWVGAGLSGAQITTLNGIINTFVASK